MQVECVLFLQLSFSWFSILLSSLMFLHPGFSSLILLITLYASWVPLNNVCREYMLTIQETEGSPQVRHWESLIQEGWNERPACCRVQERVSLKDLKKSCECMYRWSMPECVSYKPVALPSEKRDLLTSVCGMCSNCQKGVVAVIFLFIFKCLHYDICKELVRPMSIITMYEILIKCDCS